MNKDFFAILSIVLALFIGALYYSSSVQKPFINVLNYTKSTYHKVIDTTLQSITEHFNQKETIVKLQDELVKYKKNHLLMHQMANELNGLYKENNISKKFKPYVSIASTISYVKFADKNKIYLQTQELNQSEIYGLVSNEITAGIVTFKNSQAIGLLNPDIKCSYSVYVGKNKAPGIIHGNNKKELIVEFMPAWIKVEVGDEVITSGLDKLFFKGLKVGKILSITNSGGYQNAVVKPYYNSSNPDKFHIINKVR